jgi:hypothetical protein
LCSFFWYVGIQDVNRSIPYEADKIHGTQKMHSVKTKCYQNLFSFDKRNESCFYSVCIEDTNSIEICENKNVEYIKSWIHTKLNIKGKISLASLEDMESNETVVSVDGDRVFDLVREGNFYV